MKQLLIIRHAKSSWSNALMGDFDRPLNERGMHDAPMMAKRLIEKKIKPDAIISSTANRAFTTAGYFAKEAGIKKSEIITYDQLYHAPADVYYEVIDEIDDNVDTVAIIAHNPGITDFINELTNTRIDSMPTCGIFAIQLPIKSWKHFDKAEKHFWFFDAPKLG